MRFGKFITTALVAGAGLALSASAFAQSNSAGTLTSGTDGISTSVEATAIIANINFTHTFTSGAAAAAAVSSPLFGAASGGLSLPEFSYNSGSSTSSSSQAFTGSPGTVVTSTSSTSSGTSLSSSSNGRSATDAFNGQAVFIHIDASQDAGSTNLTGTHGTGVSVSSLFVFEQTLTVTGGSDITDATGQAFLANATGGIADGVTGSLAFNQVAGIANQQGNNLSTVAEVTGAGDTTAGSNAVENEGRQTLVNDGTITEEAKGASDTASLGASAGNIFGAIAGAVAFNQAAGISNQQVNNITLAH